MRVCVFVWCAQQVNTNSGWFSVVKAGVYENLVEGTVFKLSDEETPLKLIEGHAGTLIHVTDVATKEKKVLFNCDALTMEKICFLAPEQRPVNSSLVIWRSTAEAILADDMDVADREKTLVETAQRAIRKKREEEGAHFTPQYFTFDEVHIFFWLLRLWLR